MNGRSDEMRVSFVQPWCPIPRFHGAVDVGRSRANTPFWSNYLRWCATHRDAINVSFLQQQGKKSQELIGNTEAPFLGRSMTMPGNDGSSYLLEPATRDPGA
jgi:hypothetical protein